MMQKLQVNRNVSTGNSITELKGWMWQSTNPEHIPLSKRSYMNVSLLVTFVRSFKGVQLHIKALERLRRTVANPST